MHDPRLLPYLRSALETPGWRYEKDLLRLGHISQSLRNDAVIVEVGCLFGRSSIMLAGARKIQGSGRVHCVDPFDLSGDAFSVPYYREMLDQHGGGSLLDHFNTYIGQCGLGEDIAVHVGTDDEIAKTWTTPIDLLLIDGDQSPIGARRTYEQWIQFLVPGGWLVVSNSADRIYSDDHDGYARVFSDYVRPPQFKNILRGDTSFAQIT